MGTHCAFDGSLNMDQDQASLLLVGAKAEVYSFGVQSELITFPVVDV